MKVAITHDWLVSYGGAEKVLEALLEVFPGADVFTSVLDKSKLPAAFDKAKIIPSFIQQLPYAKTRYRSYLGLMPAAFKSFDLQGYDLIISNSHACAKNIRVPKSARHICYCLTPMRYIWDMYGQYMDIERPSILIRAMAPLAAQYLRHIDVSSSKTVEEFAAISKFVAQRIKKYYGRESKVIYPPVGEEKFKISEKIEDYYLVVSRLVPQKRTNIIISAFNELGLPLKIIGTGRDEDSLRKMAKNNIEFLGFQSEGKIAEVMSRCKALVFASLEDFGIVPVEAMACGRPVIAYGRGGVLDTVTAGKTGIFFDEQTSSSVARAVLKSEETAYDPALIKKSVEKFDKKVFKEEIKQFVERVLGQ
ncbi:MAG: glycosyltransferase [Candidatus Margulisiibacteriota bacterium]